MANPNFWGSIKFPDHWWPKKGGGGKYPPEVEITPRVAGRTASRPAWGSRQASYTGPPAARDSDFGWVDGCEGEGGDWTPGGSELSANLLPSARRTILP